MASKDPFLSVLHDWIGIFIHRSTRGHVRYAREKSLSRSMLGTLHFLRHHGNAGVSDLGEHLGVSNAASSQMVERLVEEGLLERVEDQEDRRMKKISLTEKGLDVLKDSINARLSWIEDLAQEFNPEEKDQITTAIQIMIDKVRELYPCPEQDRHH
jgi:DNA-binding MarR family transcriptional regulator